MDLLMAFTRFVFRRAAEKVSVVLRKDVMGVGGRGEEKVVAAGYMRNYVYPKGIAAYGTPENISAFAASESVATEDEAIVELRERLAKLTKRLIGNPLQIKRNSIDGKKTSPGDVTAENVVDALRKKLGVDFEADRLRISSPESFAKSGFPVDAVGEIGITYAVEESVEWPFTLHVVRR